MEIRPFQKEYLLEAAALFVQDLKKLRQAVPILPDGMEDASRVASVLDSLLDHYPGLVALEGGRLVGYMGWWLADDFRGTGRKGAYCPEWSHSAVDRRKEEVYRAMYRAASAQWAAAGCQVHAITLLAHDRAAEKTWFWNGFGLTVVDAIRPMQPLEKVHRTSLEIRKTVQADVDLLSVLDAEHWKHYTEPPVFMPAREGRDAADFSEFLARPKNSTWLAMEGEVAAGFIRFDGYDYDGVDLLSSECTVCITGAYVRPAYRGRGAAVAMLDAALRDYASQGLKCCAVNFESFNPEAAAFWMKYFEPVCLSVIRVPES